MDEMKMDNEPLLLLPQVVKSLAVAEMSGTKANGYVSHSSNLHGVKSMLTVTLVAFFRSQRLPSSHGIIRTSCTPAVPKLCFLFRRW